MTDEEKFEIEAGLEPLQVRQSTMAPSSENDVCGRASYALVVANEHMLYHRTTTIASCALLGLILAIMVLSRARDQGVYEPKVDHDFSNIHDLYELKKAEIESVKFDRSSQVTSLLIAVICLTGKFVALTVVLRWWKRLRLQRPHRCTSKRCSTWLGKSS